MTAILNKATEKDKHRLLNRAISKKFSNSHGYPYLTDYDESYVYWDGSVGDGHYEMFRTSYTMNGVDVELGDEAEVVVSTTEYQTTSTLVKALESIVSKFGDSEKGEALMPIVKQFEDEKMIAIEPLYIAIGDVDGVGDTYASPEVCYDMVKSFNKACEEGTMSGNYFHKVMTEDFTPVRAWVNECDCMIGETEVKKGMPLVEVQYVNKDAWDLRKQGEFMGVSIGAVATWEEVDE
jgi:hypothetical protein